MQESRTEVCWVFSAYAEVVPQHTIKFPAFLSILRVRGGSSVEAGERKFTATYSPRTRR